MQNNNDYSFSGPFIDRPVATTLLTWAIALAGMMAYTLLPVAPLPQVDFPTISVSASLPGASPETMASSVATPLERALGKIAGVTEMTSSSVQGSTRVVLQFDLSRDIDGAARDVQAAINAANSLLPSGLPGLPTYRKVNPADAPIMILSLTSDVLTKPQLYDAAATILAQKLAQLSGVGQVNIGGGALPAVRVEMNPMLLQHYGISSETVRQVITANNVNRPKGILERGGRRWQIDMNDQAKVAKDYLPLIVNYAQGAAIRLGDIATVRDSVENVLNAGMANGKPAILLVIYRQPGANIIQTVDNVNAALPILRGSIAKAADLNIVLDRTPTIRASLYEAQRTMLISILLVVLVVFVFLRNIRATFIPSVVVPVSLIGTFSIMYLCGFSLNNLSLMALTIATGFVVDDAIVVVENISRHLEKGLSPLKAALKGAREIGFTVMAISISLIAVFIPILLMDGIVGRLFREFAVTLSVAILISLLVSLTTTPMLCARWLKSEAGLTQNRPSGAMLPCLASKACFAGTILRQFCQLVADYVLRMIQFAQDCYKTSLMWVLNHGRLTLFILIGMVCLNVYLYCIIPKGFFPQQDTGRLVGILRADQRVSFQAMQTKLQTFIDVVRHDQAVQTVVGFTGGGQRNVANMFIALQPLSIRKESVTDVMARLRARTAHIPGVTLFMQAVQDIRVGGRSSNAQYQFTLQADNLDDLRIWEPRIRQAMLTLPQLVDANSDTQDAGLQTKLWVDRDQASRFGVNLQMINATLNNAFGQRQVSTIYNPLNQYHVILDSAPQYWQNPQILDHIEVISKDNKFIPLSDFAKVEHGNIPLSVNHQGQFVASTISFNLPKDVSLSDASAAIASLIEKLGVPETVRGGFFGTAKAFQDSLASQPWLILTALLAVYIVLGILYESLVHPLTILSTLPSAGIGALLALLVCRLEFSIVVLIGVILLIGIVKKNAIMMIDFAIQAMRTQQLSAKEAIYQACLLRFRPIMMTTLAAMLGALPLALGVGDGAEFRQPLGVAIVGGLLFSQLLTLYTTPIVYLYMDRLRLLFKR